MLFKKLNNLHARLFAIVLLALLPVLIMALNIAKERYQEAKASALSASKQLALQYSREGMALFDRAISQMSDLAASPEVQSRNSAACAQLFRLHSRVHPTYGPITLSRPDGSLVATSLQRPETKSLSTQEWFQAAARNKTLTLGTYQDAKDGAPARLPLAMPVLAPDGTVLSVLSMSLDQRALADLLDDLTLSEGVAVSILDRSGVILARFPADPKAVGVSAPDAETFLPDFVPDGLNTWESKGVDGVQRLYYLTPLLKQDKRGIVLRVGMPKALVLAAVDRRLVRDLSFIAAMTVLAFFVTWLFSNAFVLKQVRQLWRATKRMSEGDYSYRIGATGSGELIELSMAFDGMADVLESKTNSLTTAERKYRKIFEHSVNGIFQTTPDGRMLEANPALARMLGYESPEALIHSVHDVATQLYADPKLREEIMLRLRRDGIISGFEMPALRANAERIWVSLNVHVVRNDDGTIGYLEGSAADITYRKMIEENLKLHQEKLQALLDYSPALIAIRDAEGKYILVNRIHQNVHGLGQEVIGKGVDDLFPPEEARSILEEDRQVLAAGKALTFQRSLSIQGVERHFLTVKFPLFTESGQPDRVCSIAYDISDYEQVREALRQSEEKYRTMIQTSPDLIWMFDPKGFILEANNASRDLLGYEPEELRGMHLQNLFHPDDVRAHDRELLLSQLVGQGKTRQPPPALINERRQLPRATRDLAVRLLPKTSDGQEPTPRYFELSSCGLWRSMTFLGTMAVIRDVTERKQAEMALRESQDLLAYALSLGKIGGWAINLKTKESRWTDGMFRVLGHSGKDIPPLDEGAALFAPEDRALFVEAMRKAEQGEPLDVDLRLAQRGTSQRWVRVMGRIQDKEGAQTLGGLVQDITDSKNLELLRDDIDNIIRHDLKTPLNGIINLPQIILAGSNLNSDQIECLGYIEMSGKKMLRQVEMALDIMKIERSHYQFQPYPIDLLDILRVIIQDLGESVQRKRLSVEVLLQGEPLTESGRFEVSAEERLCFPMLANLIANAIEASPAGERITINLAEGAEHVVSIRNLGPVPPDIRERFFEKFVTSGKTKGTGLGTYSAWLFAKAQGGSVELDASEEGATTVVVRLPKATVH